MEDTKIIALLTDFGTKDYFVGAVKGAILSINSRAKIIDITHDISPQNIAEASFTLGACYKDFPSGTIFVSIVDPGVGSHRRAILVEIENYFFIAPDNGILSFLFEDTESPSKLASVYELTNKKYFAPSISATFHGRDVFAPVAAHLSNGVNPCEFGAQITNFLKPSIERKAEIIHIDRFGNLITNLKREDLPPKFTLEINGIEIQKMLDFYSQAEKGELFMIVGSAGFLEIVAFQDSAQEILQAQIHCEITLKT